MSACVPTRTDDPSRKSKSNKSRVSLTSRFQRPHSPPSPDGGDGGRRRFRIAGADFSASISVFLIALPLSLGIALATGAPLQAGLVAAAVGGIVAGRLGGSPLQVSGPAAGLTVVTADLIQRYGWRTTCAITVVAGLAQLGLAALRVARSALAVSPAIVHGMLAGIGVTIALAQLHIVLGGTPQSSAVDNVRALPAQLADLHTAALSASVLTVAVLLLWPRIPGRAGRIVRTVPAALAAVAGATAFAVLAGLSLPRVDLPSWSSHALPELPQGPVLGILAAVLTITLVGSVESLLSAVAVDKLVAGRKEPDVRIPRAHLDRELAGQGAANVVSGALGGLPVTGVAVRSAANVSAGGVSRNATMLHGLWIAIAALLLVPVLDLIPLASLAALVMVVGIQMVSITHLRSVQRNREMLVYAATLASVVATGVLEGVVIGIGVAVAVALHRLTRTRIIADEQEGVHRVRARGQLTFLAVPRLSRILGQVPQGADCVVELDGSFMDHAAYEALNDWQASHVGQGGTVEFTGRAGGRISEPASETHGCCRPWTPWRNHHCDDRPPRTDTHQLASGLRSFQRNTAPLVRDELARLAREGQRPSQLFLTCADSRLVTSMITASGPGDLFTVRNVGNLVPLPGAESSDDSVAAAIEYAVDVLAVDSITICGHSGCGAMQALLNAPPGGAQTPLRRWLRHGLPSMERMKSRHRSWARISGRLPTDAVEQLCLTNVVQQLEHLRAHEAVARRLAEGTLELHGMYFHVGEAQAYLLASSDEHEIDAVFDRVAPAPSALVKSRA
ncbi:bifunctional SulP family inorganic anion transporter/carbonic anhydrase [Streptomyces lunaelactis]|uniref:bifunctional SulP family inorganic anion transporter/carbonic anhydrase n=1 Tax=Streptomyces lunaelactis TaxID=1535768 RepID=UPI001585C173|nr:SulP family inorganic anion transporter [Streptomyces lunaelactis]NUK12254.1 bifunctional SulP family inorganic anion transporter/carbonic anhydrase [Streptomyces lunaelactis]NUK38478.1 bifunctional SulP family inorganic anion transporter/carbonic anhydrase [Streptomyces lunaelactis]NUK45566.1 bifunctional SulP family inorganic anion transporter/carbonic anhydrase [Streptomyces lunaelactis]NUK61020.1 bifunctional SulP family inorganic anion transporter/carbonic anhydrase [Streptomyces lunael